MLVVLLSHPDVSCPDSGVLLLEGSRGQCKGMSQDTHAHAQDQAEEPEVGEEASV